MLTVAGQPNPSTSPDVNNNSNSGLLFFFQVDATIYSSIVNIPGLGFISIGQ